MRLGSAPALREVATVPSAGRSGLKPLSASGSERLDHVVRVSHRKPIPFELDR